MKDEGKFIDERSLLLRALLIETVQRREEDGTATTLRDLHRLLDVPQPVALRLADLLRAEGVVRIDMNDADAFASIIRVSRGVANRIRAARKQRARPLR